MGFFSDGSKGDAASLTAAIEEARRRLKENPGNAGAVLKLADVLAGAGRKTEAVRLLNRFGPSIQARGRLEQAIAIFKKAAQLDPECELTTSTYLTHLKLKKILETEESLRASAPSVAVPPPSGTFTRPGPDPPPPSGAFARPEGTGAPPPSGSVPRPAPAPAPPPSGSIALPGPAPAPPSSGSIERPSPGGAPPSSGSIPLPEPPPPSAWKLKKDAVHGARAGIPLLRDIPPFLIDLVLQRINLVTLAPGEVLFREGSEGNSVFFVVQGSLDLTVRSDVGANVLLRTARDGEAFGEASFLTGLPRYTTVIAREDSNLLELDHNALAPIARKHRPLADALNRLYEDRVLNAALARSRVFGVLPEADRRQMTRKLETQAVPAGTVVVQEGFPAKGAYLVKRGAFRLTFRSGDREVAVALLRPHEVFGDFAEGAEQPLAESVTAVTESELLCLAPQELAALRARAPRLAAALEALRLERAESCVAALRGARR